MTASVGGTNGTTPCSERLRSFRTIRRSRVDGVKSTRATLLMRGAGAELGASSRRAARLFQRASRRVARGGACTSHVLRYGAVHERTPVRGGESACTSPRRGGQVERSIVARHPPFARPALYTAGGARREASERADREFDAPLHRRRPAAAPTADRARQIHLPAEGVSPITVGRRDASGREAAPDVTRPATWLRGPLPGGPIPGMETHDRR